METVRERVTPARTGRAVLVVILLAMTTLVPGLAQAHPVASGGATLPWVGISNAWFSQAGCDADVLSLFDESDGGIKDVSAHKGTTGNRITVDITPLPTQPNREDGLVIFYTAGCAQTGNSLEVSGTRTNVTIPANAKWILVTPVIITRTLTSFAVTH